MGGKALKSTLDAHLGAGISTVAVLKASHHELRTMAQAACPWPYPVALHPASCTTAGGTHGWAMLVSFGLGNGPSLRELPVASKG